MDKTNIPTVIRFANFTDMQSRSIYCIIQTEKMTTMSMAVRTRMSLNFHSRNLSSSFTFCRPQVQSLHMPQDFSDIGSGKYTFDFNCIFEGMLHFDAN